jgi:hypothetical protein
MTKVEAVSAEETEWQIIQRLASQAGQQPPTGTVNMAKLINPII